MRSWVLVVCSFVCLFALLEAKQIDVKLIKDALKQKFMEKKILDKRIKVVNTESLKGRVTRVLKDKEDINKKEARIEQLIKKLLSKRNEENNVVNENNDIDGSGDIFVGEAGEVVEMPSGGFTDYVFMELIMSPYFSSKPINRKIVNEVGSLFLDTSEEIADNMQKVLDQIEELEKSNTLSAETVGPVLETFFQMLGAIMGDGAVEGLMGDLTALLFRYFMYGTDNDPTCMELKGEAKWECFGFALWLFDSFIADPMHPAFEMEVREPCNGMTGLIGEGKYDVELLFEAMRQDMACMVQRVADIVNEVDDLKEDFSDEKKRDKDDDDEKKPELDRIAQHMEVMVASVIDIMDNFGRFMYGVEVMGQQDGGSGAGSGSPPPAKRAARMKRSLTYYTKDVLKQMKASSK